MRRPIICAQWTSAGSFRSSVIACATARKPDGYCRQKPPNECTGPFPLHLFRFDSTMPPTSCRIGVEGRGPMTRRPP
jgi:hypothetical protein